MTTAFRLIAVATVVLLAGCAATPVPPRPTASPTPLVITTPSPTPAPKPTAAPSPTAATTGLTAASIHPESVTFISPDDGWVLGLSMCADTACLKLAKTVDAGKVWTWVSTENLRAISAGSLWQLRFADGENGWISGPALFATHDAGAVWTRIALPALDGSNSSVGALETADGRVYAEIAEGTDANPYGPVALFGSRTSDDAWYAVPGVSTGPDGGVGNISVAQGVFWASLHPAVVTAQGNESSSTLYRSLDGVTWRTEPLPCPSGTVASVGAATSHRLFLVCAGGVAAGSQGKTAYRSDDDGATYARIADPPFGGDFDAVAASPTSVSVAASSGATNLYTSFDDGQTWTAPLLIGDGGLGLSNLGFTTATQGVAIHGRIDYPQSLQLLMTRNGGHQWSVVGVDPI